MSVRDESETLFKFKFFSSAFLSLSLSFGDVGVIMVLKVVMIIALMLH